MLYVQRTGNYHASFQKLSQAFQRQELPPIRIEPIDELLEPDEVMVAREIRRETVRYVDNIYKYYLSYRRVERQPAKNAKRADNQEQ